MRTPSALIYLLLAICSSAVTNIAVGFQKQKEDDVVERRPAILEGNIVDEDGKPIEGALILENRLLRMAYDDSPAVQTHTDKEGHFRLEKATSSSWGLTANVFAPGFANDLLTSVHMTLPDRIIQLHREEFVRIRVLDPSGKPAAGVRVAPCNIDFHIAYHTVRLSEEQMDLIATETNDDGYAELIGTTNRELETICVKLPNPGWIEYVVPTERDPKQTIDIRLAENLGSLHVRIVDHRGDPVARFGIAVSATPEATNPLTIKGTVATCIKYGYTNSEGQCLFENIAVGEVDVVTRDYDSYGRVASAGLVKVPKNGMGKIELRLPETQRVAVSVIDSSEFEAHAGIEVVFRRERNNRNDFAAGVTNEDGIAEVDLPEGAWEYEIQNLGTLPEGHCLVFPETQTIKITAERKSPTLTPLRIKKGRLIEGRVLDINPKTMRSLALYASAKLPSGDEEYFQGRLLSDGTFRIFVTEEASDEDIKDFRLYYEHLSVESRSPWLLRKKPKAPTQK